MEAVVVENIYLLVIVTLISVLQNGEKRPLDGDSSVSLTYGFVFSVFFALKVEKECNHQSSNAPAFERVSCAK